MIKLSLKSECTQPRFNFKTTHVEGNHLDKALDYVIGIIVIH